MDTQDALSPTLRMVGIRLIGMDVGPQFVNPLSLSVNGVTDDSWLCEKGSQIGITECSFSYTNGVSVEASEDTISFTHTGIQDPSVEVLSTGLAERYIDCFGAGNWFSVVLEFRGVVDLQPILETSEGRVWHTFVDQLAHRSVPPQFRLNLYYTYPDRRLSVDLIDRWPARTSQVAVSGTVFRDLPSDGGEAKIRISQIMDGWRSDWEEVAEVTGRWVKVTLA